MNTGPGYVQPSKPYQMKEMLDNNEEPVHVGDQSATDDAGKVGLAARLTLKHEKSLNKGLPEGSKDGQAASTVYPKPKD